MPLITRTSKGSKLTIQEMDGNLTYLETEAKKGQVTYEDITLDKDLWVVAESITQSIDIINSDVYEFGLPLNTSFDNTAAVAATEGIRISASTTSNITFEVKTLPIVDLLLTVKIKN